MRRNVAIVDRGEHPAESGGGTTDREHQGEGAAHIDAERGDHETVLDAGPNDQAVPGEFEEQHDRHEHQHRHQNEHEAVVRNARAENLGGLPEPGRARHVGRVGAPDSLEQSYRGQREADRHEYLFDVPVVQPPDQEEFGRGGDERPDHGAGQHGSDQCPPRPVTEPTGYLPADEGADGQKGAVSEVEHAHQAVDEGEPGGDQKVQSPEAEAGDQQQNDGAHAGTCSVLLWSVLLWSAPLCTPR